MNNLEQDQRNHSLIELELQTQGFDFGFRLPITTGIATLVSPDNGSTWIINFEPPRASDNIWYGNCVQDALTSAAKVRAEGMSAHILKINVNSIGNSPRGHEHFRAIANGSIPVDHSGFFSLFVTESSSGYVAGILTEQEEKELAHDHTPVSMRLFEKAYSEPIIDGAPSLFEVSIWSAADFRIGFDITLPNHQHPDYRAYLSIGRGAWVDKTRLNEAVSNEEYLITIGHPGQSGFTEDNIAIARRNLPLQAKKYLKTYFREMIEFIPNYIPR